MDEPNDASRAAVSMCSLAIINQKREQESKQTETTTPDEGR